MEDKNNGGLKFQSTGSKLEIQLDDSAESIADPENTRRRKMDCTAQRVFVTAVDMFNHALIILVTSYLVYHAAKQCYVTNVHVILCTIGYVLLMSEATLVLAGENILTSAFSRQANKNIHWILQVLGLICNVIGVGIMYNAKSAHFLSTHGILGFSSFVIMCVLAIFGYPVMIAVKLRKFVRPVVIKLVHNFLGIVCFVLGMLAQCYGYSYKWVYSVTHVENIDMALLVLTAVITLLSLRGALFSLTSQTFVLVRSICPAISYTDGGSPSSSFSKL
ncbi:probable ascorbate-specific transmembrane electron transporter 1 [Odontomachus brunneus]|uniref:probable ascorbate-specific transmembrane electron transporter 1 n=1 Tax=Odontomachus brunneus TaxID=486640 RepID=UPI0013F20DD7|nr:probable ascorbate-specific transmembrane electron transporter 1 [Odontomachus brunneus]